MTEQADTTAEEILQALLEPCKTKEELRLHMLGFLKISFPDQLVDEQSTSTPLDFVWDVYHVMLTGKGPHRHVVAAARNTAKTLSACVLRWYAMVHFRRDGTHLAANLDQSKSATTYLDKFLQIPELAPFISVSNTREKALAKLPPNSYTARDNCALRIAVATVGGVNSQRGSFNTRDELDLVPPAILSEAAYISDPTQDEHSFEPVEINLSSRKTNSGPVQQLLDEAETKKATLQAHKWSLVDFMRQCPTEVHQPEKGPVKAWINIENLRVTWDQRNYDAMPVSEQSLQREVGAFEGCRTCPAFIACQGRAPRQNGTKTKMLRSIDFIGLILDQVKAADKIVAQALNWKPESSAVVFRQFNRPRHFLEPAVAYKWLFKEAWNPNSLPLEEVRRIWVSGEPWEKARLTPSKKQIYNALIAAGWLIYYGIDWGYYPDPAVCSVIAYHRKTRRAFVLHSESANNYANQDWARYVMEAIWPEYPGDLICPDMEDPASPSYFGKYHVPCLDTKPARVETGVSQIRSLLWSPQDQVELFAVLDDSPTGQNELFAQSFEKWTHKKTPLGFDFTRFEDKGDWKHWPDTTRYALDPFLEDVQARLRAQQPKTEEQTIKDAAGGDEAAQAELMTKAQATGEQFLVEHLRNDHAMGNIHSLRDKIRAELAAKEAAKLPRKAGDEPPPKKSSNLKFRF